MIYSIYLSFGHSYFLAHENLTMLAYQQNVSVFTVLINITLQSVDAISWFKSIFRQIQCFCNTLELLLFFIYFLIARTRKAIRVRPLATARSSDSSDETCSSTSPWDQRREGREESFGRSSCQSARKEKERVWSSLTCPVSPGASALPQQLAIVFFFWFRTVSLYAGVAAVQNWKEDKGTSPRWTGSKSVGKARVGVDVFVFFKLNNVWRPQVPTTPVVI